MRGAKLKMFAQYTNIDTSPSFDIQKIGFCGRGVSGYFWWFYREFSTSTCQSTTALDDVAPSFGRFPCKIQC